MIGRGSVCRPTQCLSERQTWVGRLPTRNQIEIAGEAIQQLHFRLADFDAFIGCAVSGRYVEVTANNQIASRGQWLDCVQKPMHRARISAGAGRTMNTDDRRLSYYFRLRTHHPSFKTRYADLHSRALPQQNARSPFPSGNWPPEECVAGPHIVAFQTELCDGPRFLTQHYVGARRV